MSNKSFILSFTLLLLALLQVSLSTNCPPGYFYQDNIEHPCWECYLGNYCPGDDKAYKCPEGTSAPGRRQTQCDSCPSGRSDLDRIECVLPDTPKDAREPVTTSSLQFALDQERPYWFSRLYFSGFDGSRGDLLQFTFVDIDTSKSRSVVVYASTKTGKPGPGNYEFTATGPNATFVIPRDKSRQDYWAMVYFNVVPVEQKQAQFIGKRFPWLAASYTLTEETTVIDAGVTFAQWVDVAGRFVIDKVPANSVVNFTATLEGMRFHDDDVQFSLYYTSLKTIQYPNENNAQTVVTSRKAQQSRANLVVKVTDGGPFFVSLATRTLWDARITIKVTVTRQVEFRL